MSRDYNTIRKQWQEITEKQWSIAEQIAARELAFNTVCSSSVKRILGAVKSPNSVFLWEPESNGIARRDPGSDTAIGPGQARERKCTSVAPAYVCTIVADLSWGIAQLQRNAERQTLEAQKNEGKLQANIVKCMQDVSALQTQLEEERNKHKLTTVRHTIMCNEL